VRGGTPARSAHWTRDLSTRSFPPCPCSTR
jgi:hypothetical protein